MIKTILYVGSKYEYNIIENGESLNKKAFHDNFELLGYEVISIWFEGEYDDLQDEIIATAARINPDLIFFILQRDQVKPDTLLQLQKDGHFTVNWFGDDHWRFDSFTARFANCFSACITTYKFSIDKYLKVGQRNVIQSEWASLSTDIDFQGIEYLYDVSFVGGASAYRKWFVKELNSRGVKVHCFGDRWPNGRVDDKQMGEIFCRSKINLSISNSTQFDIRFLLSSPRNIINTIRNPKTGSHVKARNFEIPNYGGFQLTEYAPCLEDSFSIGKDMVCYGDIADAEVLIKYYLNHDDEREKIKIQGVRRARKDHTFVNRIKDFMRQLDGLVESQNIE